MAALTTQLDALTIRGEKESSAVVAVQEALPVHVEYGKAAREHFLFAPGYRNLNHGSFGSIPREIQAKLRSYQDQAEARPDPFIRYEYPRLLDESRAAIAALLNVPTDTCVFVPNATTAVNTVLRNMDWTADGLDEVLYFDTVYGGCGKTIDYIVDSQAGGGGGGVGGVGQRAIPLAYPCEDAAVVAAFEAGVRASRAAGRRPRICLFDTVSSLPGVRFPFEAVAARCRALGLLSLVDGAQGVGLVALDLGALDPDFFTSNCHKWLHVPRGCAVLYVALRHQPLVRSTLPTSHGYVPRRGERFSPLPPSSKGVFVNNFEFVGTVDNAPYLCVRDSIRWRRDVLGGEERILAYLWALAKEGGAKVAAILGTEVMDNATETLTDCAMVNVALPLRVAGPEGGGGGDDETRPGIAAIPEKVAAVATHWMLETLMAEYNTFIVIYVYRGRWWTRLSAQVYLDMEDFVWAGKTLKELCERAVETFA